MTVTEPEVDEDRGDAPVALAIKVGSATHTIDPAETPLVIGRDDPGSDQRARINLSDGRISRRHLVIDVRDGQWTGIPEGRNGVFLGGVRADVPFPIPDDGLTAVLGHPADGIPVHFSTLDPALVYVGALVAARRRELDIAQRTLAAKKVINAGALISFEKGRSWPREKTQHKLEETLGWPVGTIARLRREHLAAHTLGPAAAVTEGERTEDLAAGTTTTVDASYMADAVELALANIRTQVDALPPSDDSRFQPRVGVLLADLSRLETLARNASRGALGAEAMFMQLSAVRRAHRDLMLRAAASPHATLGQRLFAARQRAQLTVEEAAAMVGLSGEDVTSAEAGHELGEPCAGAVRRLLAALR